MQITNKRSFEISRRKLGFEGPTNIFLKRAFKSLIRLCLWVRVNTRATAWLRTTGVSSSAADECNDEQQVIIFNSSSVDLTLTRCSSPRRVSAVDAAELSILIPISAM